jgi:ketopantoate reductase
MSYEGRWGRPSCAAKATSQRERVGKERTVGAFVHFGADLLEPGVIQLGYEETIRIGELDSSITPRLEALADAWRGAIKQHMGI